MIPLGRIVSIYPWYRNSTRLDTQTYRRNAGSWNPHSAWEDKAQNGGQEFALHGLDFHEYRCMALWVSELNLGVVAGEPETDASL